MSISADEIETKAFVVSLRGYDRGEVDRWLQDLAEEHRRLVVELEAAQREDEPIDLREQGDVFTAVGQEVADVLRAAREAAAAMFDRAIEAAQETIERQRQEMMAEVAQAKEASARAIDKVRAALVEDLLRDPDAR